MTIAKPQLIDVRNLSIHFPIAASGGHKATVLRAVEDVSLSIAHGEVLGLVGESGSGKSTLGQAILRLVPVTSGQIYYDGNDITRLPRRALSPYRRRMQVVFQDPYSTLDPRQTVGDALAEPLHIHKIGTGAERAQRVNELLELVGLTPGHARRYPHELSGGQRQRVGIARALALEPDFVFADEPVSALDVSIQAQILTLIQSLRKRLGLTMLFVSHDLGVVRYLADRVAVLYLGRVVEVGTAAQVYSHPRHPYTQALLSAATPVSVGERRERIVLKGDLPSPLSPPSGCAFRTRCPKAVAACADAVPALRRSTAGQLHACIYAD